MRSGILAVTLVAAVIVLAAGTPQGLYAQGRAGGQAPASAPTARAAAPIDLTGNWVSIISEDWRWRMVTPAKGDYQSVPITAEAKRIADAWDPAKDQAAGEQCKSYGAPAIMRVPTRLRVSWLDEITLKVDADAGMQTRLLRFGAPKPPEGPPTRQGHSVAEWEMAGGRGAGGRGAGGTDPQPTSGSLKVVTTHMRAGYLRKNGIPYSADAVLTEYWDLHREPNGDQWLVVTSLVDDPKYLQQQYVTSPNFKKERDGSKWNPTPCSATW